MDSEKMITGRVDCNVCNCMMLLMVELGDKPVTFKEIHRCCMVCGSVDITLEPSINVAKIFENEVA